MSIWQKLENLFAASAFAEEGDFETARQITGESVSQSKTDRSVAAGPAAHIPSEGTINPSKA